MPHTQRQQVGSRGQRSPRLLTLLLLLLSLAAQHSNAAIHIPSNLRRPPVITTQPKSVTVFSVEDFGMNCEASGNPPPIFRWTKDGREFVPGDEPEMKVSEESGTSAFYTLRNSMDKLNQYQGSYVCYASNELGTAVSEAASLITAEPPTLQKEKKVHMSSEQGSSILLRCNPPQSSMEPIIHWMDWRLRHIVLTERVVVGKDGNLYFANLVLEDSRKDYTCNVQYLATRTILPKEPISLTVNPSNSVVRNKRPQMMRPTGTDSTQHVLRGQTFELECIVQGLPTPEVLWIRKDGELSETRTSREMFGRRLRFTNISESDAGEYQCKASNSQGKTTYTYTVIVEASPYWTKEPVSQLYAPGETVRLDCQADGIPPPNISWSINGVPLSDIDEDPIRTLNGGSLILHDVTFQETAIYQCQASNKHGTILTNTNVYVIELPPQILTDDGATYTVAEGHKIALDCETFGSPQPKVTWDRESASGSILADPRVNQLANGGLEINNVTHDDAGIYTCSVQHNNLSVSAELEVLNRTVIVSPPQPQKVQPGQSAIFTCDPLVDPRLDTPHIQWRKNSHKLFESQSDQKYTMQDANLIIADVSADDEAVYSCHVITRLDFAEASATLTLWDRPDPPTLLQISDPQKREVTLSWTPGNDKNSPLLEYVIEFEDWKNGVWEPLSRVRASAERTRLVLRPNMSYRFRVIAVNEVGQSHPSKPSNIQKTDPEAPDINPQDVRSESTDPDSLVIVWEAMDNRSFNGPNFRYKVQWRRVLGSGPTWHSNFSTKPPFIVSDVGNFSAFEIKVRAVNDVGVGPPPDPVIGYSGEDVPLEAPMNVGVETMNSSSIKVTWLAIDRDTVRGHLLGYKIYLTRTGSRGHKAKESESTVVLEAAPNEMTKLISGLRPYSHYTLTATVYNSKGEGPECEMLSFITHEGVPGPPMSLTLDSPSETEINFHWTPPSQPNGELIGYRLEYQQIAESDENHLRAEHINDPAVTHHSLTNLDPHSHYRFSLRGRTAAGAGDPIMKEGATTLDGAPPANISVSVGENSVNFSWVPKQRHRNINFQIHYLKKTGGSKKRKTEKVTSSQSSYQLQGLTSGSHYRVWFTYSNTTFWEDDVETTGTEVTEVKQSFATQGWFIGVVSAIVLLLLILLILCFIKRSKGGKYSVKDKEEGPMDSEARPMKDETFGEYRSLESDLEEKHTASQPSLCEESKLCSEDNLDFNGSSAITTELHLDESLASQLSRPSEGADYSPLNPPAVSPVTNGTSNSVTFHD